MKKIITTIAASLLMCGVLAGCNSGEGESGGTTTPTEPDVVSMSALGYDSVASLDALKAKYQETKKAPITLSYSTLEATEEVRGNVVVSLTWTSKGYFNPQNKQFTFGGNVESFLYDYINVNLMDFAEKEGKWYQYGYTSINSTSDKPYCIVEKTMSEITIYEYDETGHVAFLKFEPVKNTVKSLKISPADECEMTKETIGGHIEYQISKYVGYGDQFLLSKSHLEQPITTIKKNVFKDISISKVYFLGTEAEFNTINVEEGNDSFEAATKYFYSESAPTEEGNFFHFVNGEVVIY